MFAWQTFRFFHRANERAYIIAANSNRNHFPRFFEVDVTVVFDALHQHFRHEWHVGRRCTDFGHVELTIIMVREWITFRIARQIWIELFENVRECGRIAPIPLAADAPRQAAIFYEQILHAYRRRTTRRCQRIAQCRNHIDVTCRASRGKNWEKSIVIKFMGDESGCCLLAYLVLDGAHSLAQWRFACPSHCTEICRDSLAETGREYGVQCDRLSAWPNRETFDRTFAFDCRPGTMWCTRYRRAHSHGDSAIMLYSAKWICTSNELPLLDAASYRITIFVWHNWLSHIKLFQFVLHPRQSYSRACNFSVFFVFLATTPYARRIFVDIFFLHKIILLCSGRLSTVHRRIPCNYLVFTMSASNRVLFSISFLYFCKSTNLIMDELVAECCNHFKWSRRRNWIAVDSFPIGTWFNSAKEREGERKND